MLQRLVVACFIACSILTPIVHAQAEPTDRERAVALYKKALELRKSWKTWNDYHQSFKLAYEAWREDPTYEPATLDFFRYEFSTRMHVDKASRWINQLNDLLKTSPNSTEARYYLAVLMNGFDEAHKKVLGTEPKYLKEVDEQIDRMLAIDAKWGDAYVVRAMHLHLQGKLDSGLAAANRALELQVTDKYLAYKTRAIIYMSIGLRRSAREDAERASDLLDQELKKLPKELHGSWRFGMRQYLVGLQAQASFCLDDEPGYRKCLEKAAALIPDDATEDSPQVFVKFIRTWSEEAKQDNRIPWDRYPGTISGLLRLCPKE